MSSLQTIGIDVISTQIRSIIIVDFLNEYNKFELLVRQVFEKNIPNLLPDIKNQLYFLYGGKISTYYDYAINKIRLNETVYKQDETFKNLTINQILKFFQKNTCINDFMFDIPSIRSSMVKFSFFTCAFSFLRMRNCLAHEMYDIKFKTGDVLEQLALDYLKDEFSDLLKDYDIENMDYSTKEIASNIVYIRKTIEVLEKQLEE